MAEVALALLAAGKAARMGTSKQLLPVHGVPMLRRAALDALCARCRPVMVIVGSNAREVARCVADLDVQVVTNRLWNAGVGSSIHAAVDAATRMGAAAMILALADQPLVGAAAFDELVRTWERSGCDAVASRYAGTVGVPALFARSLFDGLRRLPAADGCKRLLLELPPQRVAFVDCPEAAVDIDTPEEYSRFRSSAGLPERT